MDYRSIESIAPALPDTIVIGGFNREFLEHNTHAQTIAPIDQCAAREPIDLQEKQALALCRTAAQELYTLLHKPEFRVDAQFDALASAPWMKNVFLAKKNGLPMRDHCLALKNPRAIVDVVAARKWTIRAFARGDKALKKRLRTLTTLHLAW